MRTYRYIAILLLAVSCILYSDLVANAQQPIKPPVVKPVPKPDPKPVARQKIDKVAIPEARTSGRSLDLQVRRDGRIYYFNTEEWRALSAAQKKLFKPDGVVMKSGSEAFVVALHDEANGKEFTWDQAMFIYGESLPDEAQADIMSKYKDMLNEALSLYDGETMEYWYWTCTESKKVNGFSYVVAMDDGPFRGRRKTEAGRIRIVFAMQ